MESRFVNAGGYLTYYLTDGQGDPVVLVHGASTTAAQAWNRNLGAFAGHYRVYAPDLVGWGKSDRPNASYTMRFFIDFVRDFADALGLSRMHLVGHSIGGGACLGFALDHPDRVSKLVLIDSAGLGDDYPLRSRLLFPLLKAKAALTGDRAYMAMSRTKGGFPAFTHRLSELRAPTLLVWAGPDGYAPVRQAIEAKKLIPNCRLHVFRRGWHSPHREHSEEFNKLALDFLR